MYLCSPFLQMLELSVVQISSRWEHLWQLQVAVHQAADGVTRVAATQRRIDALQRLTY